LSSELEFLGNKEHTNEEQAIIHILQEQTRRMIHVVRSLLILAKGSGAKREDKAVFELKKLLHEDILPQFPGHRIIANMPAGFYLRGHRDYFAVALLNLVENAIKYSPSDSTITIDLKPDKEKLNILVADQGFGVPDDEKTKLFDRFYRGRRAQAEGIPGYGLGLSLAATVVETMSGSISIRDNRPTGSIFTITLPRIVTL